MVTLDEQVLAQFQPKELKLAGIIGFYKREIAAAPADCGTVVDIGSGRAGIDVALCASLPISTVHLIDGQAGSIGTKQNTYSQEAPQPWRDVNIGVERLATFGFTSGIKAWPPDPELRLPCDLIVSILSWCHHYPAETYLGLARRSLRPGGRIIVDCRDNTDAFDVMSEHFLPLEKIGASAKRTRWVFEKPPVEPAGSK